MEWMEGERPVKVLVRICLTSQTGLWEKHTSMHTEDLVVDDNAQGKKIEHIRKVMPNVCVSVLSRTLGIESI